MTLPHIKAEVAKLQHMGKSQREIAQILGINCHEVRRIINPSYDRNWISRTRNLTAASSFETLDSDTPTKANKPTSKSKTQVTISDKDGNELRPSLDSQSSWAEWVDFLKQVQGFRKIKPMEPKDELKVDFKENLPIGISIFSDTHLGDSGLAYELLDKHVQLVRDTSGMYCVFNGDELNNFLGSLSHAGRADLVQNEQQWEAVEALFTELQESILTVTMGNHNAWTSRHAGINMQARVNRRFNLVDIGNGAKLDLQVGDQVYTMMLRHKYRNESASNPGNAVMKMHDEFGPFDIGCIGHVHAAACGWQIKQNKRVGWIRPGSYKVIDEYAEEIGFPRALPLSPTVILYPNEKKFELFDNISDAVERLNWLRR